MSMSYKNSIISFSAIPSMIVLFLFIYDAQLHKYYGDSQGNSLFVANSKIGKHIITKGNVIQSQSELAIKYKTRNIIYGNMDKHTAVDIKYKVLIYWIKNNKNIFEFFYKKQIISLVPLIVLKIYSKTSGIIKRSLD